MHILRLLVSAMAVLPLSCGAYAQVLTEAPNWRDSAQKSLLLNGRTVNESELASGSLRCIKMNNYGCIMQPGSSTWNGSIGRDSAGHAVFSSPEYSIRAIVLDYCSKHKRGARSAIEVAEIYTPWCDTLGTVGVRNGWGRTCTRGPRPPSNFSGPLCQKPASGVPLTGQCTACNCPNSVAENMVAGLPINPNEPMNLFGQDGRPNVPVLQAVLLNKSRRELGRFSPTSSLLSRGIELAGICR